jgi:hypothetical protein
MRSFWRHRLGIDLFEYLINSVLIELEYSGQIMPSLLNHVPRHDYQLTCIFLSLSQSNETTQQQYQNRRTPY